MWACGNRERPPRMLGQCSSRIHCGQREECSSLLLSSLPAAFSGGPRPKSALHCPSWTCHEGPAIWAAGLLAGPHSSTPTHPSCPFCKLTSSEEASLQLQPVLPSPFVNFCNWEGQQQARVSFCLGVSGTLSDQELCKNVCVHMCMKERVADGDKDRYIEDR